MKFPDMPYKRPDYPRVYQDLETLTARLKAAQTAPEQVAVYKEQEQLLSHVSTQATICSIRNTVDTRDAFYEAEQAYHDEQAPLLEEKLQAFHKALVESPLRPELEKELGSLLFLNLEM